MAESKEKREKIAQIKYTISPFALTPAESLP
jgi:hypothetical protein